MHIHLPRLVRDFVHDDILPLMVRSPDDVATSVSYVYKTASKTFSGPAVYITQGLSTSDNSQATTTSHSHSHHTTAQSTQEAQSESTSHSHSHHTTSSSETTPLLTASSQSSTSTSQHALSQVTSAAGFASSTGADSFSTGSASSSSIDPALAAGGSASTSSTSPSASAKPDSGMSVGAKAGLSIAIILILAIVVGVAAVIYRKKKQQQQKKGVQRLDDEKGAMSQQHNQTNDFLMTAGATAPANRSESGKAASIAPRLSLRPVTQLFGFNNPNRKSAGNPLDMAPASGPAMAGGAGPRNGASSPYGLRSAGQTAAVGGGAGPQNSSAWEKMGQRDHANDPSNPFGDHARSRNVSPPGSAIPNAPDSPTKTDSVAIFTGAAAALAATGAAASRSQQSPPPLQTSIVPKPLSIKSTRSIADGPVSPIPVSPTRTEASEAPSSILSGVSSSAAATGAPGGPGPNNVHRVQLDFKPSMDDELELHAGQLVRMLHAYDDGWALCVRMDRSHQGVVPRTCLSAHAVKPRPPPNGQGPRGPPPSGAPRNSPPRGPPRGPPPMGPPGGSRNSPGSFQAHSMTPNGRNSPGPQSRAPMAPFSNQPRPGSPGMRTGPPGAPGGRARAGSVPRSMSPGPSSSSANRQQMGGAGDSRRRSKSMGAPAPGSRRNSPPGLSPLGQGQSNFSRPQRKPVPQAQ